MIKDKNGVQTGFSLKITINLISYSCFAYSNSQIPQIVTTTVSSVSTDPSDKFLDFLSINNRKLIETEIAVLITNYIVEEQFCNNYI
jgi:hypothetical protein